jgi:nucleoside-triphosphatase THEP1
MVKRTQAMITIVSGQINTGKTRWMRNQFENYSNADGFLSLKNYKKNIHTGYNLLDLNSGEITPFIRKPEFIESDWNEIFRLGNHYSFSIEGFKKAEIICNRAISKPASFFFLDEIGPLELQGKGFMQIFSRLLENEMELVIAVRKPALKEVIKKFNLKNYKIITPWADNN